MNEYVFKDFRVEKPKNEGTYVWRLNHRFIENLTVVFTAKFRWRGAGYESVLSPEFDYWDGYRVILPDGKIEWAEYNGEKRKSGYEIIALEGIENAPCPFCGQVPKWLYYGRHCLSGPTDTESFYLECCGYFDGVKTREPDPRILSDKRNKALASCRNTLPHGKVVPVSRFSTEVISRTRKALKDDAAGNSKCTMTDLDTACDMLDELIRSSPPGG